MTTWLRLTALVLLSSCGFKIETTPIRVDHYVHVDLDFVREACAYKCYGETACIEQCIKNYCVVPNICVDNTPSP